MEQDAPNPIVTQRFMLQILGAEPVDLDANNAMDAIRKNGKGSPAYKIALVAVLPEADAGALIARAKGHRIPVETIDAI